jgi:hypothetical protein
MAYAPVSAEGNSTNPAGDLRRSIDIHNRYTTYGRASVQGSQMPRPRFSSAVPGALLDGSRELQSGGLARNSLPDRFEVAEGGLTVVSAVRVPSPRAPAKSPLLDGPSTW